MGKEVGIRVFLTEATGCLGSAVARELIDAGPSVMDPVRSKEKGIALAAAGRTPLIASLADLDVL